MREEKSYKAFTGLENYLNILALKYQEQHGNMSVNANELFTTVRKVADFQNPALKRLNILIQSV